MPMDQRVEKVNSKKIMHKQFSPAFFKRRWGQGAKPLSSFTKDKIFPHRAQEGAGGVASCGSMPPGGKHPFMERSSPGYAFCHLPATFSTAWPPAMSVDVYWPAKSSKQGLRPCLLFVVTGPKI